MDTEQFVVAMIIVRVIVLGSVSILTCLYAIPLCFIRRFHTPLNLLTLNVCIAAFVCSTYWAIFYVMDAYYPHIFYTAQSCLPILYLKNMVICQELYAVCVVSLNRLFTIVYKNKALFRTKKWVAICVTAQWILGALLPLAAFTITVESCLASSLNFIYLMYLLIISIAVPAISLAITNTTIFIYVRRSTRRIQPANGETAQASALGHRDASLLKHMIFLFSVDFLGWLPIYIIMILLWSGTAVSPIVLQIFLTVPTVSLFIDIADLFFYNHELRKYFTHDRQMERFTATRA